MDEKRASDLCDMIENLKAPGIGIWDVSDMEMIEFDHTTPSHRIRAFLDRHPGAVGAGDLILVDGEWHVEGWMLSGAPTKKVGDLDDIYAFQGMHTMDTKGARRLLFNLAV